jgi:hypothetical protein
VKIAGGDSWRGSCVPVSIARKGAGNKKGGRVCLAHRADYPPKGRKENPPCKLSERLDLAARGKGCRV